MVEVITERWRRGGRDVIRFKSRENFGEAQGPLHASAEGFAQNKVEIGNSG